VTSEADSDPLLTYRQVGRLLGVGERAALNWVREHNVPITAGRPARVRRSDIIALAAALDRPLADTSEALPHDSEEFRRRTLPTSEASGSAEPIEAAYRVAGEAAAEVALVPLVTMVAELRGLADQLAELARRNEAFALEVGQLRERQVGHEGQLVAKDETIATQRAALATKDQALEATTAAKDSTIVELRRRAEQAEAERDRLAAAQGAPAGPGAQEATAEAQADVPGVWAWLRRWWRG